MIGSDNWNSDGEDDRGEPLAGNGEPAPLGGDGDFDAEPAKLDLGDEDVALPWLQGDDEGDGDEGHGSGQLVSLLLLGLLAIAAIVGGIWWLTRQSTDTELVADGSVIEAPGEPYKERPEDPGGKTFEGTGDTSFAVSQGETRPARLGAGEGAPAKGATPGFESVPRSGGSPATAGKPGAAGPATTLDAAGVGVQVGAYSTRAAAEAGWTKLAQQHSALSALRHRIIEGKADIGTVYRLQAVAADAGAARALCGQLKASGQSCQVKN